MHAGCMHALQHPAKSVHVKLHILSRILGSTQQFVSLARFCIKEAVACNEDSSFGF